MQVLHDRWWRYRLKNLVRWQLYWAFSDLVRWAGRRAGDVQEWRSSEDAAIEKVLWELYLKGY